MMTMPQGAFRLVSFHLTSTTTIISHYKPLWGRAIPTDSRYNFNGQIFVTLPEPETINSHSHQFQSRWRKMCSTALREFHRSTGHSKRVYYIKTKSRLSVCPHFFLHTRSSVVCPRIDARLARNEVPVLRENKVCF